MPQTSTEWTLAETIDWYLEWGYAEWGRESQSEDEWQQWAFEQIGDSEEAPASPGDLLKQSGRASALPPSPTGSEAAALEAAAAAAEKALSVKLEFGKYKGETLRSVRTVDPAYVRWMATRAFCRDKPALKAGLVACGVLDADGVVPVTRVVSSAPAAAASGDARTSAEATHAMLVRLKTGPLAALQQALDADIESLKVK